MRGYGRGGGHYSKYTQQVSFREPGWTDNVKTVYLPTNTVCGGIRRCPRYSPLKKRQESGLTQSDFEKASEFNGQFTDVFTKTEHSQVPLLDISAQFMEDIVATKEGVATFLKESFRSW